MGRKSGFVDTNTKNTEFPPSSKYGTNSLFGTSGKPLPNVGDPGDLASDPNDSQGPALYIKGITGWKFIATGVEV